MWKRLLGVNDRAIKCLNGEKNMDQFRKAKTGGGQQPGETVVK